jgi:hypothetical protein
VIIFKKIFGKNAWIILKNNTPNVYFTKYYICGILSESYWFESYINVYSNIQIVKYFILFAMVNLNVGCTSTHGNLFRSAKAFNCSLIIIDGK